MDKEDRSDGRGSMLAARLHGPSDLRLDSVPHPGPPARGQVLVRVTATGICGSDLHSFRDGRIGDTVVETPLTLGHEFAGTVEAGGPEALDGRFNPIQPGTRVAIDPAQPCGYCELCEKGHPNLCSRLQFCGNYPAGGSLCQWTLMPARSCFPVPDTIDDASAALLEPLGVALHAIDLARIRVATSVAILGAGPIGLYLLQLARLAGADPIFVSDKFPWRLKLAQRFGAEPVHCDTRDPVEFVNQETAGRGVDVAIEAAWGDHSVDQAADMTRSGGRLILVGIPSEDRLEMKHSTARRKGLTILMSRRMKHTYPRAMRLAERAVIDLHTLISHRLPLTEIVKAFQLNAAYEDQVVKIIIEH